MTIFEVNTPRGIQVTASFQVTPSHEKKLVNQHQQKKNEIYSFFKKKKNGDTEKAAMTIIVSLTMHYSTTSRM